mgnify:CR=1 FL=1
MTDLNGTPTDNQAAPEELSQAETSQPEAQPDQVSENTQIDAVVEEPSVTTPYPSLTEPFTSKTVSQEYDINKSDSLGKALEPGKEYIPQPSLPMADTIKIFDQVPEASEQDTDSARRYFEAVNVGTEFVPPADRYVGTTERVNSLFRQYLQTEKGRVGFAVPKFAESDVSKVAGDKAVLRVRALMGMGSLISIPLWHSGFWITISAPSEMALLELRRRLMDDKVTLGRQTHGLVFNNTQSFTTGWLLDMVMDLFYDSTLKDQSKIRSMIKTPDLPILFWGLACAIWPNGYQYSRAILTEEGIKSKEIVTGKIDVAKLMWVDNNSFTTHQKAHMSNRIPGSVTEDAVNRYLDDFALFKGREVEMNENVKINLNVPSADEYVRSGHKWVSDIITMVDRIFTSDADDLDSRRVAIDENARVTSIRQYGHWIESISIDGVEHKDRDTIDAVLNVLSENSELRKKIFREVGRYIDDITVAVIAIPESTGKETGLPRFPRLIPLDVGAVFFTLLMQRIDRLLNP